MMWIRLSGRFTTTVHKRNADGGGEWLRHGVYVNEGMAGIISCAAFVNFVDWWRGNKLDGTVASEEWIPTLHYAGRIPAAVHHSWQCWMTGYKKISFIDIIHGNCLDRTTSIRVMMLEMMSNSTGMMRTMKICLTNSLEWMRLEMLLERRCLGKTESCIGWISPCTTNFTLKLFTLVERIWRCSWGEIPRRCYRPRVIKRRL